MIYTYYFNICKCYFIAKYNFFLQFKKIINYKDQNILIIIIEIILDT